MHEKKSMHEFVKPHLLVICPGNARCDESPHPVLVVEALMLLRGVSRHAPRRLYVPRAVAVVRRVEEAPYRLHEGVGCRRAGCRCFGRCRHPKRCGSGSCCLQLARLAPGDSCATGVVRGDAHNSSVCISAPTRCNCSCD